MKVRVAVSVAGGPPNPTELGDVVAEAEEKGFDTIWLSDVPMLASTDPMLGVAFAAARSSRMHLGINLIPFGSTRFVIAHRLAQLDRLTGGRLLVTLVPGLDQPGERQALGTSGRRRGDLIEEMLPELRSWWAGEEVDLGDGTTAKLAVTPKQAPLEVWLGGSGPGAIRRAGRVADGWLGARVSPERAGEIRREIIIQAETSGRTIDPEHFGLSVAYARTAADLDRAKRIRLPRPAPPLPGLRDSRHGAGSDPPYEAVPVGASELRNLIGRLVAQGLSKFVVRPAASPETAIGGSGWPAELEWLAGTLLELQS
jgi:alkanesulfonate monooxygenase SsuD/methylene tetrahydromethanopterin reductase-like flavin-dependent oxidoreductase (luciferase family)